MNNKKKNKINYRKIAKACYKCTYDDKDKEEILKGFKYPYEGKVITYKEFLELDK